VDARDQPWVSALVAEAERLVGPIDVLVNCGAARPPGMFARLEDVQAAEFEEVLRTHVVGTFLTCQQFGTRMAERGRGSIVNFGSIYGVVGPDQRIYGDSGFHAVASYSAAKGGIIALSRYLATHWGERGVRVNAVSPGGVFNNEPPDFVRAYSNRVPLGRMARVDEVVSIVTYLVSPSASYVTGQNLLVDGGLTAW
jgi:NAD(P)-dependent dehydrogenase (short-subunit alcohol dehydrogenase family)